MARGVAGSRVIMLEQARKTPVVVVFILVVLLFVIDALFAEQTPVHLRLVSTGTSAALTVDGGTHTFAWPAPPTRLAILPNDPNVHEWGIDGSETLTLNNLDAAYLSAARANPYIALDRWLRGEDGYDEWHNVQVAHPATGRIVLQGNAQALAAGVAVPGSFVFDADLYRIERPVMVQLSAPSGAYQLRLDRAGRAITVSNNPISGTATTITQWYFPTDSWPYLAINVGTVTRCVAWAALLFLAAVALGALVPLRLARQLRELPRWAGVAALALPVLALGSSLALTLYITLHEYNGMPHILDAQAYLLQGRMLAMGRTAIPPPSLLDTFPVPFFGPVHGHWTAQYAPGTALTLVPGLLVGWPWLVEPLLGAGTLALAFGIGRRLYGPHVAVLAVVLGALSPFRSFLIGAYLSHPAAAFFSTLAYYLLVRAEWGRRWQLTTLAGAAAGMAFLCREVSSVLVLVPLTACLGGYALHRRRQRGWWLPLASFSLVCALFLTLYGLYNWSMTGSLFVSPRAILNPGDRYGFGPNAGWWGRHTLAAGLVNMDQLLTGLILDLYGWPYYMALAVPLLPFVLGRANRWDVLNASLVLCMVVGLVGYFYHGIIYGPRYYYEAVPALLLLTARGVQVVGAAAGDLLASLRRLRLAGPLAAHLILIALILPNLFFYLPRHLALYRNFTSLYWMHNLQVTRIYADAPQHAIVVTNDWWIFANVLAALNSPAALAAPAATRDDIWAVAATPTRYRQLRAAFPRRRVFVLVTDGTSVRFQRWPATAARSIGVRRVSGRRSTGLCALPAGPPATALAPTPIPFVAVAGTALTATTVLSTGAEFVAPHRLSRPLLVTSRRTPAQPGAAVALQPGLSCGPVATNRNATWPPG